MFSSLLSNVDKLGDVILDSTIPHRRNNHRPYALQGQGLFLILVIIISSQITVNFFTKSGDLLGYATNITSSAIISLTNQERNNAGFSTLGQNPSLASAAVLKANDMLQKDYWAHFSPDGTSPWYFFGLVGYQYSAAGENLARDFATSSGVVNAWMVSSGHKANILNSSFTQIGVGVVNGNLQGNDTTLVVQLFGRPLNQAAVGATSSTSGGSLAIGGSSAIPVKLDAEVGVPSSEQNSQSTEGTLAGSESLEPVTASKSQLENNGVVTLVKNTTQSQRVTMILLLLVGALFATDSFVIFRKRHLRVGSHSFVHASVMFLLAISSFIYGWGNIL